MIDTPRSTCHDMVMECRISTTLLGELLAEARASHEVQLCGLLLGHAHEIEDRIAIPNVAKDPFEAVELDRAALDAAHQASRIEGYTIIGVYHSHKGGRGPEPLRQDARRATEPGRYWLMIAGTQARLWVSRPGGSLLGAFDPVELIVD